MFGYVMVSNSTMIGEMFESFCLKSLRIAMKNHLAYIHVWLCDGI